MAADKNNGSAAANPPTFTEVEMGKARAWFKKAADCRDRREYDYAIECYITGLGFWPEAVEEGHMPLRSLAIQRQQVGGKKPGMMEGLKRSTTGKDAKQAMLNAEYLLAKDPANTSYLDAVLKNSNRGGFNQTVKWIAPLAFESLKKGKKPDKTRFRMFRDELSSAAERADAQGDAPMSCWLLEQAVASLEYLMARMSGDEDLRTEQRDLAGKLAISKGKYDDADDFRDSLQDAGKQKLLHDADRSKQGDESFEALVAAVRRDLEENPGVPQKINALVDALLRREAKPQEDEAIAVLTKAFVQSDNYSFKMRGDDVRLRQLLRQTRQLEERARQSRSDEDKQQARLARMEQVQTELEVYRERVANYPTDLRMKYRLGTTLFKAGEFDEAIPILQAAQANPHSRFQCQLLIGRRSSKSPLSRRPARCSGRCSTPTSLRMI